MPFRILYIAPNTMLQNNFKEAVKHNMGLSYSFIEDLNLLETELKKGIYTHLVTPYIYKGKAVISHLRFVKIPILVLGDDKNKVKEEAFSFTQLPLSYSKLFSFFCDYPIISYNTLKKFAMGDAAFIAQMKTHIIDEFEINIKELPQQIKDKDLKGIKSKAHKIASKFSLLEMDEAFNLSKEIDLKILENSQEQIINMQKLLVDIEVALTQLK